MIKGQKIVNRKLRKLYRHPILFVKDSKTVRVLESQTIKKKLFINKLFFGVLIVPLILACSYYAFVASDKFASESKIIVRTIGSQNQLPLGLAFVTGTTGSHADAMIVQEYISSMTMYRYLKSELDIHKHYSGEQVDFVASLAEDAPIEDQLEYFQNQVSVTFDDISGVLTIEAIAFDPDMAQRLVKKIIDKSEEFINYVSTSLSEEQYEFVNKELEHVQQKLKKTKRAINDFSQKHHIVDPESESQAMTAVVNELKAELTKQEAQLKTLLGFMNPNSQEVKGIKNRINAIREQLSKESKNYADSDDSSLSQLRSRYHELVLEFEFAQNAYKAALATLEKVRVDTYQKKKYLVRITEPFVPEYAKYPRKTKNLVTIFFVLFIAFGTITLVTEIVKENME